MLSDEVLKGITLEDFPPGDMKIVAETCGVDVAVRLLQNMAGTTISVNKKTLQPFIERYILLNRGRLNPKQLAIQTGMTERFVYYVLNKNSQGPPTLHMFQD